MDMFNALLKEMKINYQSDFGKLSASTIQDACSEIEVAQLHDILIKYTSAEDMFTQQLLYAYLHGKSGSGNTETKFLSKENIKLLVDMGKAVETPEAAFAMYEQLKGMEHIYVRCLVEVFKRWYIKSTHTPSPSAVFPEVQEVLITDLKEQLNIP